ncbi:MAG: hypothetical protein M3478_12280 [Planctomycetota bacterium]|nr:hypothetical protein [Planctomycetota bacterium]
MSLRICTVLRVAFLLPLVFACTGCRIGGEFDPDLGRKDDDTVYRSPDVMPR